MRGRLADTSVRIVLAKDLAHHGAAGADIQQAAAGERVTWTYYPHRSNTSTSAIARLRRKGGRAVMD